MKKSNYISTGSAQIGTYFAGFIYETYVGI